MTVTVKPSAVGTNFASMLLGKGCGKVCCSRATSCWSALSNTGDAGAFDKALRSTSSVAFPGRQTSRQTSQFTRALSVVVGADALNVGATCIGIGNKTSSS